MSKDIPQIKVVGANEALTIVDLEIGVGSNVNYTLRVLSSAAPDDEKGLRFGEDKIEINTLNERLAAVSLLQALPYLTLQR